MFAGKNLLKSEAGDLTLVKIVSETTGTDNMIGIISGSELEPSPVTTTNLC